MMNKRVCAMLLTGAMLTASMAGAVQAEESTAADVVTETDAFYDGSEVSALANDSHDGQNHGKDDEIWDEKTGMYKLPWHHNGLDELDTIPDWFDKAVNPLDIPVDKTSAFACWQGVDTRYSNGNGSDVVTQYAEFYFKDAKGSDQYLRVEARKDTHADKYWFITPADWELVDAYSYSTGDGKPNGSEAVRNFNINSVYRKKTMDVTISAEVNAWHNVITPHEYYERTVDEYYERDVDEYYERTVDEFYERTVDEFYERTVDEYYTRPVTEIMQRYAQKYLVPVFEKKMAGAYNDTLVTRLDYSDNTAKATPVNGGAFKNGHTYVTVDVAKASKEGGVNYTIADSSKNNGKKTPDQYNKPIAYQYNVKIADGKLTVSCGDDLAYASVGAEVWAKAPTDAKNAPKHYDGSVTVDLPKNNGTVDLYVHFEKLGWFATNDNGDFVYQFKEWKYDESKTEYDEEYTKIDTVYGEYELVNTVYGEPELVDTVYGNYELVKTVYGEYELVDTVYGEPELVKTEYGDYKLVKTENSTDRVEYNYDDDLTLIVDGKDVTLGEVTTLTIGEHTYVLYEADGSELASGSFVVKADASTVTLTASKQNADVTLPTVENYADKEATRHDTDRTPTEHYADKEATEHYADKEAAEHYADKAAEKHYADAEATQKYNEEYLYKEDNKLGDETDADGEYAVKLN